MYIIYCLFIIIPLVTSSPVTQTPISDDILDNCKDVSLLNEDTEIKNCIEQDLLKPTKTLANVDNILCLLYRESLKSLCAYSNLFKIDVIKSVPKLTIDNVCTNMSWIPKSDVLQLITNQKACEHICLDYNQNPAVLSNYCAKAYYFYYLPFSQNKATSPENINNNKPELIANKGQQNEPNEPVQSVPPSKENIQEEKPKEQLDTVESRQKTEENKPIDQNPSNAKKSVEKVSQTNQSNDKDEKILNNQSQEPKTEQIVPKSEINQNKMISEDEPKKSESLKEQTVFETDNENKFDQQIQLDTEIANQNDDIRNPDNVDPNLETANNAEIEGDRINNFGAEMEINEAKLADIPKPNKLDETLGYDADLDGNSYFFTYFSFICIVFIVGYVAHHNKQKILALLLEGRNGRRHQRGRRPNSANYRKLDSNLEEAIVSSCNKNSSHIIY